MNFKERKEQLIISIMGTIIGLLLYSMSQLLSMIVKQKSMINGYDVFMDNSILICVLIGMILYITLLKKYKKL